MSKKSANGLMLILILIIIFLTSSLFSSINNYTNRKTFRLLMSNENKDLEMTVKNYFKKNKIDVEIDYAGTLDIIDKLNNKESYDAAWISNSIWIYLLNDSIASNAKSTSINPIVFGIKKSLAEKLGFTDSEVYTKDILEKIESKELNFMMGSATRTNIGASAYLGFLTTLAGNPEVLTTEHLKDENLINNITSFLSGVERTSGSEDFLEELLKEGKYDAVVSYESSLINFNKTLEKENKEPFYLIYPVDGVTISDSPLVYINGGDKEIFDGFQKYILSDEGQEELLKTGRRVWYGGINENAPKETFNKNWGIDTNKYIMPIKYPSKDVIKEALVLYQTQFRKPTHTIFCLDYSGSMYGDGNGELIEAMDYILDSEKASNNMLQFSYKDKVSIIPFSTNVVGPYTADDGTKTADLINIIKTLEPRGSTNIYGSLEKALETLKDESDNYNLSIILMTDGEGNVGTFNEFKTNYNIINKDIPIYGILFGSASDDQLLEISKFTGGKVFNGKYNLLEAFKEVRGYN